MAVLRARPSTPRRAYVVRHREGRQLAAGTQVVSPTILGITGATITPAATPGAVTMHPDILTLLAEIPTPTVNTGIIPKFRLRRVVHRYEIVITAVIDGLGG